MNFTEAQLENAIIKLLKQEDIPHLTGDQVSRTLDEVLIKEDLREFLLERYSEEEITPKEVNRIILELESYATLNLYESNKAILKKISDGFLFKRDDRSKKDLFIQLIDYHGILEATQVGMENVEFNPQHGKAASDDEEYEADTNIYKFVNQLEIQGSEKRIPDRILYINGIPPFA